MTTEMNASLPTQNDRIMAALAHTTAILPMMGVVAPIVIWVTQKDKSEYVGFQALQAIVYQLTMVLAWFAGGALYFASFVATFISIPFGKSSIFIPRLFLRALRHPGVDDARHARLRGLWADRGRDGFAGPGVPVCGDWQPAEATFAEEIGIALRAGTSAPEKLGPRRCGEAFFADDREASCKEAISRFARRAHQIRNSAAGQRQGSAKTNNF